jgi:hypothetical protein
MFLRGQFANLTLIISNIAALRLYLSIWAGERYFPLSHLKSNRKRVSAFLISFPELVLGNISTAAGIVNTVLLVVDVDKLVDAAMSYKQRTSPYYPQFLASQKRHSERIAEGQKISSDWLRYLVTTISVVFGIMVALHTQSDARTPIRLLFSLAMVLLALSIPTLSVSLFARLYDFRREINLRNEESRKAFQKNRPEKIIPVRKVILFSICEMPDT